MRKILGIDTGGTYTDGVIINAASRAVLCKTKTLTTRNQLRLCISSCIHAFAAEERAGVSLVCLSTTLATNAIVEGRGCREGLLLIGGRPEGKMPTERYRILRGRPDIRGRMAESIDPAEVDEAIESLRGQVEAIAVSGYASVRNPAHEIYVKERIQSILDVPVVCAHDLTASLGFYERTVTAALNARLIPLLCELIDAVKGVLHEHGIDAPLMIVKGDGTLMTEACARDKPIDTILSGPAASVIGGVFLSGQKDALVLDMGGTTTDLANVTDGGVRMNQDGAKVGGWSPRVRAAEIFTVGLGGDSRIFIDPAQALCIGPSKVIPYCVAGTWFPALAEELRTLLADPTKPYQQFWRGEGEAYMTAKYKPGAASDYGETEQALLAALARQPHTLHFLQKQLPSASLHPALQRLLADGVLARIGLTPTDVLHATGSYTQWSAETASLALRILAAQLALPLDTCAAHVSAQIHRLVSCACIRSSFYYDHQEFDVTSSGAADYFVNRIFLDGRSPLLGAHYYLKKPVVAIGAPTGAWTKQIEADLGTRVIIPPHAEVANAIGAAVGQATQQAEILIRPDPITHTFTVFSAAGRGSYPTLEEATEGARVCGAQEATAYLPGTEHTVTDQIEDVYVDDRIFGTHLFTERRVLVTAASQLSAQDGFYQITRG